MSRSGGSERRTDVPRIERAGVERKDNGKNEKIFYKNQHFILYLCFSIHRSNCLTYFVYEHIGSRSSSLYCNDRGVYGGCTGKD